MNSPDMRRKKDSSDQIMANISPVKPHPDDEASRLETVVEEPDPS